MRIPGHIGRSHPRRRLRRDGARANPGRRQGPVSSASFEPEAPPPVRRSQPSAEAEPLGPLHVAGEELRFRRLSRLAWAALYQRVFDIDPLECSSCGGRMRFVEVIEDIASARSELRRRNLPEQPPPLSRARSPDWVD